MQRIQHIARGVNWIQQIRRVVRDESPRMRIHHAEESPTQTGKVVGERELDVTDADPQA